MRDKTGWANVIDALLDAFGVVFIFLAGFSVTEIWYSQFIAIIIMMVGYILVKAKVTYDPEEEEVKE